MSPSDPMPTCLTCGHPSEEHLQVGGGELLTHDGVPSLDFVFAGCVHVDEDTLQECDCEWYEPDRLPRVTELLGLDVRRVLLD